MQRYYKIGEIAALYGIGTDAIRYYEELGLICPARGENGYRLYSIQDLWRLNVIRDLRELGFSMQDIGNYLNRQSVDTTLSLLRQELESVERKQLALKRLQRSVERKISALEQARSLPVGVVEKKYFCRRSCYEILEPFRTDAEMDLLVKKLINATGERQHVLGNTQIGARLNFLSASKGDYHQYEGALIFADSQEAAASIEAGWFLTIRYAGSSKQSDRWITQLFQYAREHGLILGNELLEIVLIDIHESADFSEHRTELQARIAASQPKSPK